MLVDHSASDELIMSALVGVLMLLPLYLSINYAPIVLFGFGCWLITVNWFSLKKSHNEKVWKVVDIVITKTDIVKKIVPDEGLPVIYFYPVVDFKFTLQGKERFGSFAMDIDSFMFRKLEEAEVYLKKTVEQCKTGFYNPKKPTEAYIDISLSPRRVEHHKTLIVGGMILCLLGMGCLYLLSI